MGTNDYTFLKYNIAFFMFSLERIKHNNLISNKLLIDIEKRIALLTKICKYTHGLDNLVNNLDWNTKQYLNTLDEAVFITLLTENLKIPEVTISVNIITFNEERCIERCIKSIRGFADEIIVIDTGSTDKTINIIKTLFPEVRLYHEPWCEDFSLHRNSLIKYSTGDWIFQIDADELLQGDQADLKDFLRVFHNFPLPSLIVSPKIINHDNSELNFTKRIFRKKDNLQYFGLIHEELRCDIQQKGSDLIHVITNFVIEHDGYMMDIIQEKNKVTRNIFLQEKMIQIEPNNIRWFYFLAREKRTAKYSIQEVIEILNEGIKNSEIPEKEDPFLFMVLLLLAECYYEKSDLEELNNVTSKLVLLYPDHIDSMYYKLLNKIVQNSSNVSFFMEKYLEGLKTIQCMESNIDVQRCEIYRLMGSTYMQIGCYEQAFKLFNSIKNESLVNDLKSDFIFLKKYLDDFLEK
ncbi:MULTISPECIES: glycosyltransferase [Bacillus cereus group]|uniref:Glycosyltransferase 2-like domain-containing protein n=1 Tax=Bacillus cereus VD048 TaxID=1053226 RepID=J8E5Z8_BACCE|nr:MULTISPECIES: glycosyltransferase family 2 protein [Bacillus cereus group]EJR26354.1 hypothetical protein IIG_05396 [Bacillus cereus VD048]WJE35276.1 glycosyltransferase family 2 protein [Bacillus mycoides]